MEEAQVQAELHQLIDETEEALAHVKTPGQKYVNEYISEMRKSALTDGFDAKSYDELVKHRAVADFIEQVMLELQGHLESQLDGYEQALSASISEELAEELSK